MLKPERQSAWLTNEAGEAVLSLGVADVILSSITEAHQLATEDRLVFWPFVGELTRAGVRSEWVAAAMQQVNLRRTPAARANQSIDFPVADKGLNNVT